MRYVLLLMTALAGTADAAYYHEDIQTRAGSSNTPVLYSTLICESRDDFEKARFGNDGWYWTEHSSDDFCRLVHSHRSNGCDYRRVRSLKGLWETTEHCYERDRLTAACRLTRWMNHKHYRCSNLNETIRAENARIVAEKQRLYEEWKPQVRAKKLVALASAEPVRDELVRERDELTAKEVKYIEEKSLVEIEAGAARQRAEDFVSYHDWIVSALTGGAAAFDAASQSLQQAIGEDKEDIDELAAFVVGKAQAALSSDATRASLEAGLAAVVEKLVEERPCLVNRSTPILARLRSLQARSRDLVAMYEARVLALKLPAAFGSFKTIVMGNVETLSSAVGARDSVFSQDASAIEKKPELCSTLARLPGLFQARLRMADAIGHSGALGEVGSDFASKVKESVERISLDAQEELAERYFAGMVARFADHLSNGRVGEAILVRDAAPSTVSYLVGNLRAGGRMSAERIAALERAGEDAVRSIREDAAQYLTTSGMRARIAQRLGALSVKLSRVATSVSSRPADRARWESLTLPGIESSLGLHVGRIPLPPAFASEEEARAYDGKVAEAETVVETFEKSVQEGT